MQEIQNLLKTISTEIQLINTSKRLYAKQLAPDFSIFKYIPTNEDKLNEILADLLNPKGSHQQDDLFLKNFIKICLPKEWNKFLDNLANICIEREEITYANQSYRRMDIYLTDGGKYGICIENKPYAKDQKDQLSDYYQELSKKHSYKQLVYLSQNLPSDYSVKSADLEQWRNNNEFSHIRYNDLVDWLNACKAECQNVSVLEFINQFIKFIQKQFMGLSDMSEQNAIMNAMLESNESIVSAIKIASQVSKLQEILIEKLNEQLTEKINQKGYQLYQNEPVSLSKEKGSGFDLEIKGCNIRVSFEFDKQDFTDLCFGYKPTDESIQKGNPIFDKVSNEIIGSLPNKNMGNHKNWLAWYHLIDLISWQENADIWGEINDGSLADRIMKEIVELYDNIVKNNIKIET